MGSLSRRTLLASTTAAAALSTLPRAVRAAPAVHTGTALTAWDAQGRRIEVVDHVLLRAGQPLYGRRGDPQGGLNHPVAIAITDDGALLIADPGDRVTTHLSPKGALLRRIPIGGHGVTSRGEHLYIADSYGHSIAVCDRQGRLTRRIGDLSQLNFPQGLAWAPDGTLHVADVDHVTVFSPDGALLRRYGVRALRRPLDLAIAPDGTAAVVDIFPSALHRFSAAGEHLGRIDLSGAPRSVSIAPDGTLHVQLPASARVS